MPFPELPPDVVSPGHGAAPSVAHDNEHVEARHISQEQSQSSDDEVTSAAASPKRMDKVRHLKLKTKEKAKKLFSINDARSADAVVDEVDDIVNDIIGDPAFNPGAIQSQRKRSRREGAKAAIGSIGSLAASLKNPKDAIKDKATRATADKLSKVQRPYLSLDADVEFLEANDDLSHAESSRSSVQATSDEDQGISIDGHRDKVQRMKAQRESLRVGYITRRHVTRVRVVPKRHLDFPKRDAFFERRSKGEAPSKYDWLKWIGYVLVWYTQDFSAQYIDDFDELPYDVDSVRRHIERIVLARSVLSCF